MIPIVTRLTTSYGPLSGGTTVGITGSGFTGMTAVYFGSILGINPILASDRYLEVVAPSQALSTVDITVVIPAGTSATCSADQFSYVETGPANQILTRLQFGNLIQKLAVSYTGLDPNSGVRIAWPQDGAPAWSIGTDQIFLLPYFDPDQITQQRDTEYGDDVGDGINQQVTVTYVRVHAVDFDVYGPHAEENAEKLHNGFLDDDSTVLSEANVALILDPYSTVWEPENFEGQWWPVGHLRLRFNEEVKLYTQIPYLASTEIIVETDRGIFDTIEM
jgi:hypothetical protein